MEMTQGSGRELKSIKNFNGSAEPKASDLNVFSSQTNSYNLALAGSTWRRRCGKKFAKSSSSKNSGT
ncbi:unnamed protein product, partial [Nesidiocoris tenuis]